MQDLDQSNGPPPAPGDLGNVVGGWIGGSFMGGWVVGNPPPFAAKFFARDRDAFNGVALLDPRLVATVARLQTPVQVSKESFTHSQNVKDIGTLILEIGNRLAVEGSPLYYRPALREDEQEPEPIRPPNELTESIELFHTAFNAPRAKDFAENLRKAATMAEFSLHLAHGLRARGAACRWYCCLLWLAFRAEALTANAAGGCVSAKSDEKMAEAAYRAKLKIHEAIAELVEHPGELSAFDHDLLGYGVWHNGGREPLPDDAKDPWNQRGAEYDIAMLSQQVYELSPQSLNLAMPVLRLRLPYGPPLNTVLNFSSIEPFKAPRKILEGRGWGVELRRPPIDKLPAESLIQGLVLHAEHPDVLSPKNLDMGEKELPPEGAGSAGMLFAAVCNVEGIENARLYPEVVALDGFLEVFLKNAKSVRCLDLRGSSVDVSLLQLLPHAFWLVNLNLSNCDIDGEMVEDLINVLAKMPSLQVIDLSFNNLDGEDALMFIRMLTTWRKIDLAVIRLDGNPLGDDEEVVRDGIEELLERRGRMTINCGDLVSAVKGNEAKWRKQPKPGTMRACVLENRNEPTIMNIAEIGACVDGLSEQLRAFTKDPEPKPQASLERHLEDRRFVARLKQHPALQVWGECADSDEED